MRPIRYPRREAVLDRIVVDIVYVPLIVILVANGVLPKSRLPQRILAARVGPHSESLGGTAREQGLDLAPTARIVSVVRWQRHHDMKMLRQNNDCIDRERPFP